VARLFEDVEHDKVVTSGDEVRDDCTSVHIAESLAADLAVDPLNYERAKLIAMHACRIAA
jgi:hypothetical protein